MINVLWRPALQCRSHSGEQPLIRVIIIIRDTCRPRGIKVGQVDEWDKMTNLQ